MKNKYILLFCLLSLLTTSCIKSLFNRPRDESFGESYDFYYKGVRRTEGSNDFGVYVNNQKVLKAIDLLSATSPITFWWNSYADTTGFEARVRGNSLGINDLDIVFPISCLRSEGVIKSPDFRVYVNGFEMDAAEMNVVKTGKNSSGQDFMAAEFSFEGDTKPWDSSTKEYGPKWKHVVGTKGYFDVPFDYDAVLGIPVAFINKSDSNTVKFTGFLVDTLILNPKEGHVYRNKHSLDDFLRSSFKYPIELDFGSRHYTYKRFGIPGTMTDPDAYVKEDVSEYVWPKDVKRYKFAYTFTFTDEMFNEQ